MGIKSSITAALLALACSQSMAIADTDNLVVLTTNDAKSTIVGTLLDGSGDAYRIQTSIGIMDIDQALAKCTGAACPFETPAFDPEAVVTLTADSGSMTVVGKIKEITEGNIHLDTGQFGVIEMPRDQVKCIGDACPELSPVS